MKGFSDRCEEVVLDGRETTRIPSFVGGITEYERVKNAGIQGKHTLKTVNKGEYIMNACATRKKLMSVWIISREGMSVKM